MSPIRLVDGHHIRGRELAAALALQQRLDLARDPHLSPMPEAELRAVLADNATGYAHHYRIIAFDGDEAAAIGHVELTDDPNNPELAEIEITAHSAGLAAAGVPVLRALLNQARAEGRRSIMIWDDHTPDRHRFWTDLGAELRYTEQESDLDVGAVDPRLMASWAAAGPRDLELVRWTGSCPDEWIDALVTVTNAMNDAPTDALDIADYVVDAAAVRTELEARSACGYQYNAILALGHDGAAPIGATEVFVNRHRASSSWQWSTVVLAAHRGQGIARRLKAEMWRWLRTSEPEVTWLRTGNARSNAAMLAINIQMGFEPSHLMGTWQGDLDTILENLRSTTDP